MSIWNWHNNRSRLGLPLLTAAAVALLFAGEALLLAGEAPAVELPKTPILSKAVSDGWLRFGLRSGRFCVSGTRSGNYSSTSSSNDRKERLTLRIFGNNSSIAYELSDSKQQFSLNIAGGDSLQIRRSSKEGSERIAFEFLQKPGEPLSFSIGEGEGKRTYQARGLWHMLIVHGEPCRNDLAPLLKRIRPDEDLTDTSKVESELLRIAGQADEPKRRHWDELVARLADNRFASREAADRQLRAAGQEVLGHLRALDFQRLDAEQQFRVRRIIRSLSDKTTDDTPQQVAAWLAGDKEIWLALLDRDDQSVRRLAAKRLGLLLGAPIHFDPAAKPDIRKAQIKQLRAKLK